MSLPRSPETKIISFDETESLGNKLRTAKKKIISTNGCFDILHLGHVKYLEEARRLGDILVVAINADASVKKLKGNDRPLNSEASRAHILAALECVDYVCIFNEDTPEKFLSLLKPEIHVKGGDYKPEDLPEKKVVESYGGKVQLMPTVPGYSTTSIIEKMKR